MSNIHAARKVGKSRFGVRVMYNHLCKQDIKQGLIHYRYGEEFIYRNEGSKYKAYAGRKWCDKYLFDSRIKRLLSKRSFSAFSQPKDVLN
ncbi:MAG: hypothetical protein HUJ30_01845 [Gammaproteobacteria bacterium]|nr:hypothetical protein [Gammaproteobacteria bacterium]